MPRKKITTKKRKTKIKPKTRKTLKYYMDLCYPIVLQQKKPGISDWTASIPMLGDSCVGDGDDPKSAFEQLEDVKRKILKNYLSDRVKIPEPKKIKTPLDEDATDYTYGDEESFEE